MSNTVLTDSDEELVRSINEPLRAIVIQVRSVAPEGRERLYQLLLAALRFRNTSIGRSPKVSATMTPAMKEIVRAYKPAPKVSDRTIAQRHNLAIGDVSEVRRNTRR